MNTAQVSIELVLAGFLALCAFVLPFLDKSVLNTNILQNEALIGILGLAYLLGVIFDKLADTLLHPMEHILRLKQADKFLDENSDFKGKDAFPQNYLEFNLKKEKDGRLDWMNSLKSRIRTSRELAVLGLPATLGIVIQQAATSSWMYLPIALNLICFIITAWLESNTSDEDSKERVGRIKQLNTQNLSTDKSVRKGQLQLAERQARNASLPYYLLLANSIVSIAVISAFNPGNLFILIMGGGGVIASMLALWACLRITRTYMKFVAKAMIVEKKEKKKATQ